MAHKKGQGSTRNGRDSNPKYLGVKRGDGQLVLAGSILYFKLLVQGGRPRIDGSL